MLQDLYMFTKWTQLSFEIRAELYSFITDPVSGPKILVRYPKSETQFDPDSANIGILPDP